MYIISNYKNRRIDFNKASFRVSRTDPAAIFSSLQQGVWYDPADFTTMFQDVAGTTPVTSPGQSVALIRDKSGNNNHASQAAASKRPVLTRRPKTGLRNILPRNQWDAVPIGVMAADYRDRGQVLAGPHSASGVTAEVVGKGVTEGISWVDVRYAGTNNTGSTVFRNIGSDAVQSIPAGVSKISVSGWLSVISGTLTTSAADIRFFCNSADSGGNNLATTFAVVNPTATWQRHTASDLTLPVGAATVRTYGAYLRIANGVTFDVTLRIGGGQVEYGSEVTTLQNAASIYDVTEPGVQDCYGLMFDGVDDHMQAAAIAWTTDEVTITAGLRKLSDAAVGVVAEIGSNASSVDGSFALQAPGTAATANFRFSSRGTSSVSPPSTATFPAPVTVVITGQGKISTDTAILRANLSQVGSSTADQGSGTYEALPFNVGMRNGTALPFSGILFGLIAVNYILNTTDLSIAERYVNSNTGGF